MPIARHTTGAEDRVLSDCECFGGMAAEAADIAHRLDEMLTDVENKLAEVTEERDELQAYIDEHKDFLTSIDNLKS